MRYCKKWPSDRFGELAKVISGQVVGLEKKGWKPDFCNDFDQKRTVRKVMRMISEEQSVCASYAQFAYSAHIAHIEGY